MADGVNFKGVIGRSISSTGVEGKSDKAGTGVYGHSTDGIGVQGASGTATGVYAAGGNICVFAISDNVGLEAHGTKGTATGVSSFCGDTWVFCAWRKVCGPFPLPQSGKEGLLCVPH